MRRQESLFWNLSEWFLICALAFGWPIVAYIHDEVPATTEAIAAVEKSAIDSVEASKEVQQFLFTRPAPTKNDIIVIESRVRATKWREAHPHSLSFSESLGTAFLENRVLLFCFIFGFGVFVIFISLERRKRWVA
jgi:hypothetical protein